ncbi:hypothetical protein [Pseudoalteromonas sp. T1lg23B]|uniref:hypothetical protein n=1 Tax=Pseudoalteromonas sp. T1lg23B TaxID=2077097 RepID=UPI000CF69683|nr:hypothetical protein [Pseudoalteromonas sp. T1lg23B]
MGFKVNHYAAKTISKTFTMDWETAIIELIIGAVSVVIGIAGYKANMLLIALPALLIACICLIGVLYNLYYWVQSIKETRKLNHKK